jgi:hypothetical protein
MEMKYTVNIDDAFTDLGKEYINTTIDLFSNFTFESIDSVLKIEGDGSMSEFNFWISSIKNGFDVQVCSKLDASQTCYMFGVTFDTSLKEAIVYHHGHGPFFMYGFVYEV